ncbi:MAG: hypothetical protein JO222_12090, partial [Frankiales bacterium]|nr:hypothetical protein [Frankiales bacterium]
ASATLSPLAPVDIPDLSGLLPTLLYPGVQVTMSWTVTGPLDGLMHSAGTEQSVTSIAHRRFKNMVVVPEVQLPGKKAQTINLNPYAGDARSLVLDALNGSEKLLVSHPQTAPCASALDAAHDDILDAVDPPNGGPTAQQILADAEQQGTPVLAVETAVNGLGIPYLDFVPVCVASSGGGFVGHLGNFGACSIDAPGGFRAALRRS